MALRTRARVVLFTAPLSFSTRETVAVETLARRATFSRLISTPVGHDTARKPGTVTLPPALPVFTSGQRGLDLGERVRREAVDRLAPSKALGALHRFHVLGAEAVGGLESGTVHG